VCACFEHYVVIAADSKAIKIEDGRVIPVPGNHCKFWTLADGMIAVGSTGSFLMSHVLSRFTHEMAEQYLNNPEGLFAALEQAIPEFVQILNPVVDKFIDEFIDDTHRDLAKSIPLLCGYDRSQQRIRGVYWRDLKPEYCIDSIVAIGYPEAAEVVSELISEELGEMFTPESVAKTMEDSINVTAQKFPDHIGGPIRSHSIMSPRFKEMLKQFNEVSILEV
jgi:hypothetical protein